jgi:multiple sugar transport system permease protein
MAIVAYNTERGILWGPMAASGILMIIPALVFFSLLQKYLARVLTFGVVKK